MTTAPTTRWTCTRTDRINCSSRPGAPWKSQPAASDGSSLRSLLVIRVAPLLRELIVETVAVGRLRASNQDHRTLQRLLVRQIERAPSLSTGVTMPVDARALAVAEASMANYRGCPPLPSLCRRAGVSVRTVQRAFQRDCGVTFELWRRQARLLKAIELLAGGASVKEVAFEIGYEGPSTFVEMFRQTMGATPKAWVSALAGLQAKMVHQ